MEWEKKMAKKKQSNNNSDDFILVNVVYEDGSQRSNRKIAASELSGFDDDADIQRVIEEQDRKIAELSGQPRGPIKSIERVKGRR
jgi:hypothetical protein